MKPRIGIRREDKNPWEKRAPLSPSHVRHFVEKEGIEFVVQPSSIRVFRDEEYALAGARIDEDLSTCPVVLAVKEIPSSLFQKGTTYIFFSHTLKGQARNMPMFKRMIECECQLIDYEKIVDEAGRRLIFFGRYAGLAGMIDAFWAFGKRLLWEGLRTPFSRIQQAYQYKNLEAAISSIREIGEEIKREGLPDSLIPLVCGFAGYGRVSGGAQEIFDLLPHEQISPPELQGLFSRKDIPHDVIYKVIFREEDMAVPLEAGHSFDLQEYYAHPERYKSQFARNLPYLSVLVNCIYWESRYPRLITIKDLHDIYYCEPPSARLRVIADISCDINGSIEATVKTTDCSNPVYVFDPGTGSVRDGWEGAGPVILAIDILPGELPFEASQEFGNILFPWIAKIARADYRGELENCDLPTCVKKALVLYQGKLTEAYQYMRGFLQDL